MSAPKCSCDTYGGGGMKNTCSQAGEHQRKLVAYARRIKQLEQQLASANALIEQARAVLLKLACLGNGEQYGNSVGNCIAQDALSLPDLSTSIIIQHDNEVIERCAKVVDSLYDEHEPWMCGDDLRSLKQ